VIDFILDNLINEVLNLIIWLDIILYNVIKDYL